MVCMFGKQRNFRRPFPDNPWTNFHTNWLVRFVFSRSFQWIVFCSIWCNLSGDMGKKRNVCPKRVCMVGKQGNFRRPLLDNPLANFHKSCLIRAVYSLSFQWRVCGAIWWNLSRDMGKKRKVCPKMVCMVGQQRNFRRPLLDNPCAIYKSESPMQHVMFRPSRISGLCVT